MEKVPTPTEELTEEQILEIAKEVSTYCRWIPFTDDQWRKVQIVATYMFNKSQSPS